VGLALVAQRKGYRCIFVCPDKVGAEKRDVLRAYGAEVVVTPTAVAPDSPESYYSVSDRIARETPGGWKPDQYANPEGPASHYASTGPEIWKDTDGRITHFVAGVGTGGTITGTGRYLKDTSADRAEDDGGRVHVVGVDPEGSVYSGGTGRPYLVEGVGEDIWPPAYDPTVPDQIVAVSDAEAFAMTRRLAREEGLLVGGSCGMAVVGALRVARELPADAVVVVLLPDSGRGYLGKIFNDAWMRSYGFGVSHDERSVRDLIASKAGQLPDLVHAHPSDTVHDVIGIMKTYGVSQMPVLSAEPPVVIGEVVGAIEEKALLEAIFRGGATMGDAVSAYLGDPLPLIGVNEPVSAARSALESVDALLVTDDGRPVGVVTRQDVLSFLSS
jgi:cystathionine beta-synthase